MRITLFMEIEIIPHIKGIELFLRIEKLYLPFDEPHIHLIRIAHINIINLPYDIKNLPLQLWKSYIILLFFPIFIHYFTLSVS